MAMPDRPFDQRRRFPFAFWVVLIVPVAAQAQINR
jgi:hypothetical protein